MSTNVLIRRLESQVQSLREDVTVIRRFILGTVEDPEGKYHPAFIKKMLEREKEKSLYNYTSRVKFLKHLRAKKK